MIYDVRSVSLSTETVRRRTGHEVVITPTTRAWQRHTVEQLDIKGALLDELEA